MEMSRNMNELCNRLNRELAHVGDMAVLRCGTCGKSATSHNAKDWTVISSSPKDELTKNHVNEHKDREEKQDSSDNQKKNMKVFVGRRSNLKLRHRRLFSKRIGASSNSRVRRLGFRGGKVLRPNTSDV